jgi:hypothetical protein
LYQIGYVCGVRNVVALLVVLGIGLVVWWKWPHSAGSPPAASGKAAIAATAPVAISASGRPTGVRRLDPEERRHLGEQIAASLKQARVARTTAAGSSVLDEDPVLTIEDLGKPVKDALQASIPLLAACYEKAGSAAPKTPLARMTMVSDPDLGTVIDNAEVTDAEGKPLEHALDECLRDAIDSLALPPIGKPGKLPIEYTFRFD